MTHHDPRRGPRARAVAAMVGSAACWGVATVMTKAALRELPPLSLLTAQLAASAGLLWLVTAVRRRPRLDRSARSAAWSGVLEPGLAYAFGIAGLARTSASHASLISTTEPLMVVALVWLVWRVPTSRRQGAALAVAFVGVGLVTGTAAPDGPAAPMGDLLIVVATLFAALYVVISSRLVVTVPPLALATLQQTVGLVSAVGMAVVAWAIGVQPFEHRPSLAGWGLIVASGVMQYALPFWLYLVALRRLHVSTAAVYLALIPVFGVGSAVVFLGESLGLGSLMGSALIVGAVLLVTGPPPAPSAM